MAVDFKQNLDRIAGKARIVTERYHALLQDKKEADRTIEELRGQLASRDKTIERLRMEVEYLRMATAIVPDRSQVAQARAVISNLVREIDRCILELNE